MLTWVLCPLQVEVPHSPRSRLTVIWSLEWAQLGRSHSQKNPKAHSFPWFNSLLMEYLLSTRFLGD